MTTTVLTKPQVQSHTSLHKFFNAYGVTELSVVDQPGDGTELEIYGPDNKWLEIPSDSDDDSCIDEMDSDYLTQAVFDYLGDNLGDYVRVAGVITRIQGVFTFKGEATQSVCF